MGCSNEQHIWHIIFLAGDHSQHVCSNTRVSSLMGQQKALVNAASSQLKHRAHVPAAPLSEAAKLQHSTAINKWQGWREPTTRSAALHPVSHTSEST